MPCNCGRTPAVQIRELKQKLTKENNEKNNKKNIVQSVEKNISANIQKLSHTDTVKISSINISNDSLNINYGGTPSTPKYSGTLSTTAFNAANGIDKDTFKSVGYFGIGFGGNNKTGGSIVSSWNLSDIDLSQFTHINIAFLAVGPNGNLICPVSGTSRGSSSSSDEPDWLKKVPKIDDDGKPNDNGLYYQVLDTPDEPDKLGLFGVLHNQIPSGSTVKILPSLGGWGISNDSVFGPRLYTIAEQAQTGGSLFNHLISDIRNLLKKGYIDGFDIDWEYPGRYALVTDCKIGKDGTSSPCSSNEPQEIAQCPDNNPDCVVFDITSSGTNKGGGGRCNSSLYNYPNTTQKGDINNYSKDLTNYYKSFITNLKNDIIKGTGMTTPKKYPNFELTVALAGAPWGLHWYAKTVSDLLNSDIIDFANVMAYDYNGFWTNGYNSGFLGNLTTMETLKNCSIGNAHTTTGPNKSAWTGCPGSDKGNDNQKGVQFTKDNNILTPNSSDIGCPIIQYNVFQSGNKGDPSSLGSDIEGLTYKGEELLEVFKDNDLYDSALVKHPDSGWYNGYITLSIETMIYLFTNLLNVDSTKLVLGLPYYGRTFQNSTDFTEGSYGLFQAYDYGAPYSYYDIHYNFIKEGNNSNVYKINMTPKGDTTKGNTENIIYVSEESKIMSKITSDMKQEMISYGSVDTIKEKVEYARSANLGGYMCWHILSDYFEDVPSS